MLIVNLLILVEIMVFRSSSCYRPSNIRSCDVSMSGPVSVHAAAISVFAYAGM